jgi:hypothetical protein
MPVMSARLIVVSMLALVACGDSTAAPQRPATRAFYYWRTTFALSAAERTALVEQDVTKLYVRVFDVAWNAQASAPELVGKLNVGKDQHVPPGIEVVPVVFLKHDVFKRLDAAGGAALARTMWTEVERRSELLGATPRELQLDCDWTESSRDRFFGFVRDVKRASNVTLSSTIRLHQVKYREATGVPPVERGMLMFYNMGKFSSEPDDRAIFDAGAAEKYLGRVHDYPLPLDVALPIWSWTVHVRDDRVIDLMQSTDPDELPRQDFLIPGFAGGPGPGGLDRFVVTRNAFLHGTLLREGDVLKVERMGPRETQQAADLLTPHLATTTRSVALFDLSERNLQRHGKDTLDTLFRSVR